MTSQLQVPDVTVNKPFKDGPHSYFRERMLSVNCANYHRQERQKDRPMNRLFFW